MNLDSFIRNIPDFPKPGIQFKDITPLLGDRQALKYTHQSLAERVSHLNIDVIAAPESRGFIFGIGLALEMDVGFVPIRKPGKLPHTTYNATYSLEYGEDQLEIHQDGISKGQRVLLVDDLLATGGTIEAAKLLVEKCEGIVAGCGFVIELEFLKGRQKLGNTPIEALISY